MSFPVAAMMLCTKSNRELQEKPRFPCSITINCKSFEYRDELIKALNSSDLFEGAIVHTDKPNLIINIS